MLLHLWNPPVVLTAVINPRLIRAIRSAEQRRRKSSKQRKKKSSKTAAAATKVRQIQIRSQAIGDEKRVRPPDRFYFEVFVIAAMDPESFIVSVESHRSYFLASTDKLSRLIRDYFSP